MYRLLYERPFKRRRPLHLHQMSSLWTEGNQPDVPPRENWDEFFVETALFAIRKIRFKRINLSFLPLVSPILCEGFISDYLYRTFRFSPTYWITPFFNFPDVTLVIVRFLALNNILAFIRLAVVQKDCEEFFGTIPIFVTKVLICEVVANTCNVTAEYS